MNAAPATQSAGPRLSPEQLDFYHREGYLLYKIQVILLLLCMAGAGSASGADEFEQIGRQKVPVASGQANTPAPKMPDTVLPWDSTPAAGFKPANKIDTQVKLNAELQRMRDRYAPFMTDLAPPIAKRPALELVNFDWRLATDADLADIRVPQSGQGEWEHVHIPHYCGPVNNATAFYRTEVNLDAAQLASPALFLHFQGVDYVADVYLNGQHAGSHEGLFDAFEFDIKPYARPGRNVLLVEVWNEPIQMGDSLNLPNRQFGKKFAACGGPGWNEPGKGWSMCPPGFGIWQRAWIESRSAAFVRDIFVRPMPEKNEAEVSVEIAGAEGVGLTYSIYGQNFRATLVKNGVIAAAPTPLDSGGQLYKFTVPIPAAELRLWSPDEPWLYQLQVEVKQDGRLIDAAKRQFGMRTFAQSATSVPKGRFYLHGEEIKLRGANMMGNLMQCVMRKDFNQLRDDILLAKIAHMDYWRMTQQPCQEEVYDYFDRLGLFAQTDMPTFNGYRKDQAEEGFRELKAMVRMVRGHPCDGVITYLNEPDFNKPMMLNRQGHIDLFHRFDDATRQLNPDQVIKWIEGDYVNLSEGYSDQHDYAGWYGGFGGLYQSARVHSASPAGWMSGRGEFGAEGLDSIALMNKYYPKAWLEKTPEGNWSPRLIPHCQTFTTGRQWIGVPSTMEDWVRLSREHQMWVVRLATESFRCNPRINSFSVHLLIDAWPAGWMKAIMDCDRQAKPAYFAYREALTPLAVVLQPDAFYCFSGAPVRLGAWVCNDTNGVPAGATLHYQIELAGKMLSTGAVPAAVVACVPQFQGYLKFTAPEVTQRQPLTVRLALTDRSGRILHDTSVDLDLFPASDKGRKLEKPGGQAQKLISS